MKHKIYEINRPMVSAESFDDETIIIHFDTGNYYSLDSFSSIVWQAIEERIDVTTLPNVMTTCFKNVSHSELQRRIDQLITELLAEDLIRPAETLETGNTELRLAGDTEGLPENAGHLIKFDDLQELLLLDPIHDVDEAGWPHTPDPENGNRS